MIRVDITKYSAVLSGRTFEAKEIIRDYGGTWDKASKTWHVSTSAAYSLADALYAAGHDVRIADSRAQDQPAPSGSPGINWAESTLTTVGKVSPDLMERAFKALAKVLHPDVGGDTRLMQTLNDAHEKTARTFRSDVPGERR